MAVWASFFVKKRYWLGKTMWTSQIVWSKKIELVFTDGVSKKTKQGYRDRKRFISVLIYNSFFHSSFFLCLCMSLSLCFTLSLSLSLSLSFIISFSRCLCLSLSLSFSFLSLHLPNMFFVHTILQTYVLPFLYHFSVSSFPTSSIFFLFYLSIF